MLDIANYYDELSYTQFAHPLVAIRIVPHSYTLYDFYNAYQPHTKKVIGTFNAAAVWDFAGLTQPVTVAVLDNGVDVHVDLPAIRIQPGRNFVNSVLGPEPVNEEYHGMACAGIIAASHTTDSAAGLDTLSGVISVAPSTIILPVKIFSIFTPVVVADSVANAINYAWQNGAEVLSNSWGTDFFCPLGIPVITNAISNAFLNGRNGKGCPVIFSSGNQSASLLEYPSCISETFSVGAITLNDVRWSYSNYGLGLDIVAPSGDINRQGDVWTIDPHAKKGANYPGPNFTCQPGHPEDDDFYCSFGGTSAAAPIVSGIAALLISKDSNLTALEVYNILRFSAVTELDSDTITPPDTAYGYGRVDAFRAALSISRGDLNNDNVIADTLDLDFMIAQIFEGGPDPFPSPLLGDCNCDGIASSVIDLTYLVDRIFRGGPPPINPCYEF